MLKRRDTLLGTEEEGEKRLSRDSQDVRAREAHNSGTTRGRGPQEGRQHPRPPLAPHGAPPSRTPRPSHRATPKPYTGPCFDSREAVIPAHQEQLAAKETSQQKSDRRPSRLPPCIPQPEARPPGRDEGGLADVHRLGGQLAGAMGRDQQLQLVSRWLSELPDDSPHKAKLTERWEEIMLELVLEGSTRAAGGEAVQHLFKWAFEAVLLAMGPVYGDLRENGAKVRRESHDVRTRRRQEAGRGGGGRAQGLREEAAPAAAAASVGGGHRPRERMLIDDDAARPKSLADDPHDAEDQEAEGDGDARSEPAAAAAAAAGGGGGMGKDESMKCDDDESEEDILPRRLGSKSKLRRRRGLLDDDDDDEQEDDLAREAAFTKKRKATADDARDDNDDPRECADGRERAMAACGAGGGRRVDWGDRGDGMDIDLEGPAAAAAAAAGVAEDVLVPSPDGGEVAGFPPPILQQPDGDIDDDVPLAARRKRRHREPAATIDGDRQDGRPSPPKRARREAARGAGASAAGVEWTRDENGRLKRRK
ncbi:unnamed protein product [Vitrella brassicaformis CCMP3155]|uniref:Uncharacterized protein n=1 Tax=Vitrella brassicaformis (strain CCMP3155) TaxID=1169540 RepID=A0A0G4GH48_VITBC|nr:unnamed protein product [Vitrella brassicaformis CCMP3155]|eukprot:CEM29055.1 unnamed protein product [Vitrella brassicaformis CCMP3155]